MNPYIKGWLSKSPPESTTSHPFKKFFVAKWRRRYFVLYGPPSSTTTFRNVTAILDYYTDDDLRCKKGSIDLSECDQVRVHLDCGPYKHVFSFEGKHGNGKRVFFLSADSDSHRNEWIDSIRSLLGLSNGSDSSSTKHTATLSTTLSLSQICKLDHQSSGRSTYEKLGYANRNFDHKYEKLLTTDFKPANIKLNSSTLPVGKIPMRHTATNLSFSCFSTETPRKSLPNSSYSIIRNPDPTPLLAIRDHDPTPPPIRPRTRTGDIKMNDLDVEVPISRPKSDSQRDSGFAGDDSHETPYYKKPRHKYHCNDDNDNNDSNKNASIDHSITNQSTSESQTPRYTKPSNISHKQAFQPKTLNLPEGTKKINRSADDCKIISNCSLDDDDDGGCYDNYLNELTPLKLNKSRNTLYDIPGSPRSLEKVKRTNTQGGRLGIGGGGGGGYQNMRTAVVIRDLPADDDLLLLRNTSHDTQEPPKHHRLRVRFQQQQKQQKQQHADDHQESLNDKSFLKLLNRFRLSSKSE